MAKKIESKPFTRTAILIAAGHKRTKPINRRIMRAAKKLGLLPLFLLLLSGCASAQSVNCSPAGMAALDETCATLLAESVSRCDGLTEECAEYVAVSEACLLAFEVQEKTCR